MSSASTSLETTLMAINGLFSSSAVSIRGTNWKKTGCKSTLFEHRGQVDEPIYIP